MPARRGSSPMLLSLCLLGMLVCAAVLTAGAAWAQPTFIEFESGHVRPITLSPDGTRLFVVNTPDNTLEIFDVGVGGLVFAASVPVGMEPVAVAARTNDVGGLSRPTFRFPPKTRCDTSKGERKTSRKRVPSTGMPPTHSVLSGDATGVEGCISIAARF